MPAYPLSVPPLLDFRGDFEVQGIASVAVAQNEDLVSRLGLLNSGDEHHQRERRSGISCGSRQIVLDLFRPGAHAFAQSRHQRRNGAADDDPGEISGFEAVLLRQSQRGFGNDLPVSFLPDPPLFPAVLEALFVQSPVIDEITGDRKRALEFRDDVFPPDEKGGRPVPERMLLAAAGLADPGLACRDQKRPRPFRAGRIKRGEERGGASLQRAGKIRRPHPGGEIERFRDDYGILALRERQGCRGEVKPSCSVPAQSVQAVHRGRNRHGDGVLVVISDGLFPPRHCRRGRIEPPHLFKNHFAIHPVPGYISPVRNYSDHVLMPPDSTVTSSERLRRPLLEPAIPVSGPFFPGLHLFQLAAENLADGALGKSVEKLHNLRNLVRRQALPAERDDVLRCQLLTRRIPALELPDLSQPKKRAPLMERHYPEGAVSGKVSMIYLSCPVREFNRKQCFSFSCKCR